MLSHEEKLKRSAATMSIVSNTTLMLFKLVVGFYVGAVSIISEAIHSAVDLIAAVIAYYAVRTSSKPPDGHHTYGHGKLENLSGAVDVGIPRTAFEQTACERAERIARRAVGADTDDENISACLYGYGQVCAKRFGECMGRIEHGGLLIGFWSSIL